MASIGEATVLSFFRMFGEVTLPDTVPQDAAISDACQRRDDDTLLTILSSLLCALLGRQSSNNPSSFIQRHLAPELRRRRTRYSGAFPSSFEIESWTPEECTEILCNLCDFAVEESSEIREHADRSEALGHNDAGESYWYFSGYHIYSLCAKSASWTCVCSTSESMSELADQLTLRKRAGSASLELGEHIRDVLLPELVRREANQLKAAARLARMGLAQPTFFVPSERPRRAASQNVKYTFESGSEEEEEEVQVDDVSDDESQADNDDVEAEATDASSDESNSDRIEAESLPDISLSHVDTVLPDELNTSGPVDAASEAGSGPILEDVPMFGENNI